MRFTYWQWLRETRKKSQVFLCSRRTYDPSITSLDGLPLSYKRLVEKIYSVDINTNMNKMNKMI